MRIAVCDYAGHPFQIQLSRHLAQRGHEVLHLYFADLIGPKGTIQRLPDDPAGFSIEGLSAGTPVSKTNLLRRRRQERRAGDLFAARCRTFCAEAVISSNMPLDALPPLQREAQRGDALFVFWLQDVISLAMAKILGKRGWLYRMIARYYSVVERRALRRSDAVVAISEDFVPILRRWGVGTSNVSVIPNWAPLADIPVGEKENSWSKRFNPDGARLILYAGTLGFKHSPGKLVALSDAVKSHPDVRVIVASEGIGADYLKGEITRRGLANIEVMPFQPMGDFPDMLAAAEILVVLIERDAGIFSVPSKLLSYLCAERAVLMSVPKENLAARIVTESGSGIVVDPEDDDGFTKAALRLIENPDARAYCGMAARRYAEQTFDIETIARRFEAALASELRPSARPASRWRTLLGRTA